MARGFESKDVEFQQAEASERQRTSLRPLTPDERSALDVRKALEMSLTRARAELEAARTGAHRRMLAQAIASLEQQLAAKVP